MNRTLSLSVLGAAVCAAILSITILAGTTGAAGPNLVQNGDFSQGATNWGPYPGQVTTLVQPYFGALSVTQTVDTANGFGFSSVQCVDGVSDLHEHTLAADLLVPSGQGRSGEAEIWLIAFQGAGCTGTSSVIASLPPVASDAWTHREGTSVPPDGTQSMWVVLYGSMAPISGTQEPEDDFTIAFDNVSLTQGDPAEPRSITVCSQIDPNGDADTESGTYIRSLFVQGNPVPVHQSFANPFEGQPADCLPLDLATLGVANETAFTVTQTLAPFTQAAGYPKHDIGAGFVSGNTANFNYPLGSGDNFLVTFANKEAAAEPPTHSLKICKFIEDNGDGVDDSATFTFQVGFDFQAPFLADFPVQAVEGSPVCELVNLTSYGVQPSGGPLLRVTENPLAGWTNQAGYPTFSANGGPLHVGTFAGMANLPNDAENIGPFIDFSNKRVAGEGGDPQPPDPTPTPPPPTETPTPPAPPPDPTETPTPPTPTGTPEPPATPTGTPTPPPPPSSTPTPTPTPGSGRGDPGTPPAGGQPDEPASQPQQPEAPGTVEATTDEAAGSTGTPAPPSAGSGSAPSTGSAGGDTLIGAVLVALGALSTAGSLAWRRRR